MKIIRISYCYQRASEKQRILFFSFRLSVHLSNTIFGSTDKSASQSVHSERRFIDITKEMLPVICHP